MTQNFEPGWTELSSAMARHRRNIKHKINRSNFHSTPRPTFTYGSSLHCSKKTRSNMASTSKIATLIAIATYYHGASAQSFADCDLSNYYSTLLSAPLSTSRADMHTLLKNTHRDQLPYSSSSYGDVWDALIALDSDTYDESGNVKLVYKDIRVPAIPYDFGTCEYWNREHLCK